jgi:hypothetical protein
MDRKTGKIYGKKGIRTKNNSELVCSLSVLYGGQEGQEDKCASSTGRAEKVKKKRGEGRKRRRYW